jgi:hypothetical protein
MRWGGPRRFLGYAKLERRLTLQGSQTSYGNHSSGHGKPLIKKLPIEWQNSEPRGLHGKCDRIDRHVANHNSGRVGKPVLVNGIVIRPMAQALAGRQVVPRPCGIKKNPSHTGRRDV